MTKQDQETEPHTITYPVYGGPEDGSLIDLDPAEDTYTVRRFGFVHVYTVEREQLTYRGKLQVALVTNNK